jgi:dienelactone hydrolase
MKINASMLLVVACSIAAVASNSLAQAPSGANVWQAPGDALVTIDKRTGRISIMMPREVQDWTGVEARFAEWRRTPLPGSGPHPATRVEESSLPTHTLYYPKNLGAKDLKTPLPVVLWANGGCRNTSVEFTAFLAEIASHGYFVIANGRNDVPFAMLRGNDPTPGPGEPPLQSRGAEIVVAGLDWASKENDRKGGKYYQKLNLSKVAALGQSCGGGQVWAASRDLRIKAIAAMNSNFPSATGGTGPLAAPPADGYTVEKLRIPAAYFIGGPADAAYAPSLNSYAATPATAQVIKANLLLVGHTGAYREPHAEWVAAVSGWLDWQLKGDTRAKAMFAGADCGLCKNANWWYEAKNID